MSQYDEAPASLFQYLGVLALCGSVALSALQVFRSALRTQPTLEMLFLCFMIVAVVSSAYGDYPKESLLYCGVTAVMYMSAFAVWRVVDFGLLRRIFSGCGVIYLGAAIYWLGENGIGVGRFVGGMTPNHFAALAGVGAMLCQLGSRPLRGFGAVVGFALVLVVNARGMLVSLGIFYALVYQRPISAWMARTNRLVVAGVVSLCIPAAVIGIVFSSTLISRMFDVTSTIRGVSSGFTGRADTWLYGWQMFLERPWLGAGFRSVKLTSVAETSHSSYIDLLREVGVLGFGSWLAFVLAGIARLIKGMVRFRDADRYRWALGVVLGFLFLSIFEINLITFAFPTGALLMLALASGVVPPSASEFSR